MFAGVFSQKSILAQMEATVIYHALSPYKKPDRFGFRSSQKSWLYEQRHYCGFFDRDAQLPLICSKTGVALAFWGRLDNRSALAQTLALDEKNPNLTDAQLVLAAWHYYQQQLPEHLLGDFALAVIDESRQRVFLARDPLGVKPLYYHFDQGQLTFASSVAGLKCTNLPLSRNTQWMINYLWGISGHKQTTAYDDVYKLLPGHCLTLDQDGLQLRKWHFWHDNAPMATRREPRWVEVYREVLEEAIRARMGSPYPYGCENSGGIDSATIAAYLAKFLGTPGEQLHSFGFALCELEPEYILATSQACHITHNYLISTHIDNEMERIERGIKVLGFPEEHGNASLHLPFYQQCEQRNIKVLYSGFGGDEVVSNPGYMLRYELLDQGKYANLYDILPGNLLTRNLRLLKSAVKRHSPEYNPAFLNAWQQRWPYCPLSKEVIQLYDIYNHYMETARYDAPFRRINDFILNYHLNKLQVSARLDNCTLMAASYGIDYRWPLWDVRLVQQYLSTPSIEKFGPKGIGRYLHRRAITGIVPQKVAWKPSKDMGYNALNQTHVTRSLQIPEDHNLAPELAALLDTQKLEQWRRHGNSLTDQNARFVIHRNIDRIKWLNAWLKDN
ncbi:asparagine synthase-related protein [Celerinatantimonas yamalensis]|uniref:asparagine synthase (glutamine-hydrolyzing) n=1 Tax=Celerinatantimonas yamalensis TaxID=559956 RepID=A0ABW9G5L9_9GAMM